MPNVGALPEHVKQGLRLIAARENKSVSRVLEEVIYDFFGITPPEFVGGREVDVINPKEHRTVIKKISRDKRARSRAPLAARATTILKRNEHATVH